MDSYWFPTSPTALEDDKPVAENDGNMKGTPSTIFTHWDQDETCSIALSRQSSVSSYSYSSDITEDTEDSFSLPMIYQTFKAELTGDYSHFDRDKRQPSDVRAKRHAASPYSQYFDEQEEAYGYSSFPKDDTCLNIKHTSPQLSSESRTFESPESTSQEMRRLIYSASRSKALDHQQDMPYSRSPSCSLSPYAMRAKSRTAPAASSFDKEAGGLARGDSARLYAHSDWDANKENERPTSFAVRKSTQEVLARASHVLNIKHTLPQVRSPSEIESVASKDPLPEETDYGCGGHVLARSSHVLNIKPMLPQVRSPRGLTQSKSWREKKSDLVSRRSFMKKSGSFTLGTKHNGSSRSPLGIIDTNVADVLSPKMELHIRGTPKESVSSIDDVKQEVEVPRPALSSSFELHRLCGLTRGISWREKRKRSLLSCRSLMERSESFTLGTRHNESSRLPPNLADALSSKVSPSQNSVDEVKQGDFPFSMPNTSTLTSEEIEVALSTPFKPTTRIGRKKNQPVKESKPEDQFPLPDMVLDFSAASSMPSGDVATPSMSHNAPEANGLGRSLGKTVRRMGSRASCRSTAEKTFDLTSVHKESVASNEENATETKSPTESIPSSDGNHEAPAKSEPSGDVQVELEASQGNDAAYDATSCDFGDAFDDLLEKVALGSLALSVPLPADEQEHEASPTVIDTVSRFYI